MLVMTKRISSAMRVLDVVKGESYSVDIDIEEIREAIGLGVSDFNFHRSYYF